MRAVIARGAGGPEVLEVVDLAPPVPSDDEVEVRVRAFGLNKAESYYRSGSFGKLAPGRALGFEAVGEVIQDPSGRLAEGQRVATALGGMMFERHGGYAERIAVKASNVVAIHSDLPWAQLAALPVATLTVWGALDKNLQIASGQSLLVRGATSSVGLAAVAYAKARGLTVIGTTRSPSRKARVQRAGADHVVIDDGSVHAQVRELLPDGVHAALEVVGASTVLDTAKALRPWGHVTVIGLLGDLRDLPNFNVMADLPNTVRLSSFRAGLVGTPALPIEESPLQWVAEQVASGGITDTTSHTFTVDQIQDAHRLLDSGEAVGKIVVTF